MSPSLGSSGNVAVAGVDNLSNADPCGAASSAASGSVGVAGSFAGAVLTLGVAAAALLYMRGGQSSVVRRGISSSLAVSLVAPSTASRSISASAEVSFVSSTSVANPLRDAQMVSETKTRVAQASTQALAGAAQPQEE